MIKLTISSCNCIMTNRRRSCLLHHSMSWKLESRYVEEIYVCPSKSLLNCFLHIHIHIHGNGSDRCHEVQCWIVGTFILGLPYLDAGKLCWHINIWDVVKSVIVTWLVISPDILTSQSWLRLQITQSHRPCPSLALQHFETQWRHNPG